MKENMERLRSVTKTVIFSSKGNVFRTRNVVRRAVFNYYCVCMCICVCFCLCVGLSSVTALLGDFLMLPIRVSKRNYKNEKNRLLPVSS